MVELFDVSECTLISNNSFFVMEHLIESVIKHYRLKGCILYQI